MNPRITLITLGGGTYTFMCFTPAIIAGHYRLFSRFGRTVYDGEPDYPWITDQETFMLVVAAVCSGAAAYFILR